MNFLKSFILTFLVCSTHLLCAQEYEWRRSNPGAGGAFNVVKVGPTAKVIACSDLSGAYLSEDNGQSWTVLGNSVGIDQTHASTVGFHTQDEDVFCIGTEDGIYLSSDGGNSFSKTLNDGYIEDISYSMSETDVAYAAYHPVWDSNNGSIYKTIDKGNSWQKVSTNLPMNLRILKIEISPLNADLVYFLSGSGDFACTDALLFKSIDGGLAWEQIIIQDPIMDFELSATDVNHLYLTTMNADCDAMWYWTDLKGALLESTDQGNSWTELSDRTGIIWIENQTIKLIDPREPYSWIDTAGTWSSDDNGTSWTLIGDVNNMETAFPGNLLRSYGISASGIVRTLGESLTPGMRYWAHTRFIYGTDDGGVSFKNKFSDQPASNTWTSRGIDNVVMYDLEISKANSNILFAGYWDIGLWRSLDKGMSWEYCSQEEFTGNWQGHGGNTMTILSDPDRPEVVWSSSKGSFGENGFLIKSNDTGSPGSWELSNQGLNQSPYIFSLTMFLDSPVNNRELLVSSAGQIFKSSDDGQNWERKDSDGGMRVFAIDHMDNDIVYAGGEHGFWRSTDRGENWTETGISEFRGDVDGPSNVWSWEGITDIAVDPFNTETVYVSVLGANKGLYKSSDSGISWEQIYENRYMRTVEVSKHIPGKIYAGSSSAYSSGGLKDGSEGILLSIDEGDTWNEINGNTPFPFALTIDISGTDRDTIIVGSPGTGFQISADPSTNSIDEDYINSEGSISLKLYPNPAQEFINLKGDLETLELVEIFDIYGKLQSRVDFKNKISAKHISFSTSQLPKGVYVLKINGNKIGVYNFIKV